MRHFRDVLLAARRANCLLSVSMWHMYSTPLHSRENLMLVIVWMSSFFHAEMWPRLMWCGEVSTKMKKQRDSAWCAFGFYRKFWQFQTLCSKVFGGNGWAMLKSDSPVRPMRPVPRKKRGGGGMSLVLWWKEQGEEVLLNLNCVQHPICSSEVSRLAEVFSVISCARLRWDDASRIWKILSKWILNRSNVQFINAKKPFQFDDAQNCFDEDFSFSLCEHVEFYSVLSAIFIKFHRFKRPSLTTAVLRVRPCRARKVVPCSFWIHAGVYGGVWWCMVVLQSMGDAMIRYDDTTYEFLQIIINIQNRHGESEHINQKLCKSGRYR